MSNIPPKGTLPSFDDMLQFIGVLEEEIQHRCHLGIISNLRNTVILAARIVDNPDDEEALDELNELLR
jgi:hypothetical protein